MIKKIYSSLLLKYEFKWKYLKIYSIIKKTGVFLSADI